MRHALRAAADGSSCGFRRADSGHWERLEARLHLHAGHDHGPGPAGAALTPAQVDYLNKLPLDSPRPFDAAHALHDDPIAPGGGGAPGPEFSAPSTTILDNGPSSNRVDIALVGDGYTEAQLPTYAAHAQNTLNAFFNQTPLSLYKSLFNVHRVDVTSNQSGVDNDPSPGVLRDTAMDMEFWCFGIERLLCVDPIKAFGYAANAPQFDQILALGNSTKYGGAGYSDLGTFAGGNGAALEIALHEFGHAFADLADEYDYGDGATYNGTEPGQPNMTKQTAAQIAASQTKWHRWLGSSGVGAYQGAGYHQFGLYRPTVDSKMRSLGRPWDAVNTEQLIVSIYKTVRPIDNATPVGTYNNTDAFFVDPVDPVGQVMRVLWFVDGALVPGATSTSFNPASLNLSGTHTLSARVFDNTALVRDPALREQYMTETRSWTLLDAQPPTVSAKAFDVDRPAMAARFTFTEDVGASLAVGDLALVNRTTGQVIGAPDLALSYDAATRTATFTFPGFAAGVLPDGNYTATLPAGSVNDGSGNALAADAALDFTFVQGDATRDGRVNLDDFNVLASNFGQSNTTFTRGDFTYDGTTNLADFAVLAARFGTIVPAAPSAGAAGDAGDADRADDPLDRLLS
jgi:hypothetical protein